MRSQLQYGTNDAKINLKKIVTEWECKIKKQFKLKYRQCWCFSLSNNARIKILISLKVWYCYKLYQYNFQVTRKLHTPPHRCICSTCIYKSCEATSQSRHQTSFSILHSSPADRVICVWTSWTYNNKSSTYRPAST